MPPPEKLFIYEIAGQVHPPPDLSGEDFLGAWREGGYTYLFFSRKREEQVRSWIVAAGQGQYSSETVLDYADWEAGQVLRPTRVAGFYLCPVWETPAPEPGDLVIRLEPGLAFGSGYHPTTRLCLEMIRQLYDKESLPTVLDLGTGTGVLTLAALALGAAQVVAVEMNELAVRTAARNLRHNQAESQVLLIQGDARHFAYPEADLALANIHLEVLLELLAVPHFLDKKWYLFSGILGTQLERFQASLGMTPLKVVEVAAENMWFTVLARGA